MARHLPKDSASQPVAVTALPGHMASTSTCPVFSSRLQMSLGKGETLDLPLRFIGLALRRKGPWKTPSLTRSSCKHASPGSEMWSHLPEVTELQRGKARVSLNPVLSTAWLYLLSPAEH